MIGNINVKNLFLTLMLKNTEWRIKMKLDMHCQYERGSIDAKDADQEYITKLVKEGFDGMLVTRPQIPMTATANLKRLQRICIWKSRLRY